jgi:hypothetical protein
MFDRLGGVSQAQFKLAEREVRLADRPVVAGGQAEAAGCRRALTGYLFSPQQRRNPRSLRAPPRACARVFYAVLADLDALTGFRQAFAFAVVVTCVWPLCVGACTPRCLATWSTS